MNFEDLPSDTRRSILSTRLRESRLLSSFNRDILIDEFLNNPKSITKNEITEFGNLTGFSYIVGAQGSNEFEDIEEGENPENQYFLTFNISNIPLISHNMSLATINTDGTIHSGGLDEHILYQYDLDRIFDARLWYYTLVKRSIELDLNISNKNYST